MLATLVWWLAIQATGLLALPIVLRLLRRLPDGGVGMARPVGLLLAGAGYWLLVTLGLLHNGRTGVVVVFLLLGAASALAWKGGARDALEALRGRWRQVIIGELLFTLGLAAFALFRAYNPDIAFTEKPMEFGFINGILRSPTFPPRDPWLSGYAISYYYLGYVIVAMETFLTGLPSALTYNLTNATLFALTLSGAYSLVANMCAAHHSRARRDEATGGRQASWGAVAGGLLGGVLVAVAGNLEGVLELIRARGWGSEKLFAWFDVKNLAASAPSATWYPNDGWWWWRASRVVHDKDALGQSIEVIDEFPFFSFLLGDNHPHVLALPFILLALSLALNVLLSGREATLRPEAASGWRWQRLLASLWNGWALDIPLWGVLVGALGFLNTWDYPIYLGILVLAYMARRFREYPRGTQGWLSDGVTLGLVLGALGLMCYLPFYVGFRSQAGGLGLVAAIKTRPQQFLLMFGTQVVLVGGYLVAEVARQRRVERTTPRAAWVAWGGGGVLTGVCLALGWWTAALGLALAALAAGLVLWRAAPVPSSGTAPNPDDQAPATNGPDMLALLMILAGFVLTVAVEAVFLRDSFGTRMNTVFKFYYQAWVLLSLAGAYGAYRTLSEWHYLRLRGKLVRGGWAAVCGLLVCGALVYPVTASVSKANGFRGSPTLDGTRYVAEQRPLEYAAIQWLRENASADAVLVEASGGSYTEYAWVSAHTGIPTLLGWGGHELQWRGSYDEPGRREEALTAIYQGNDLDQTAGVLQEYGVDYVVVGPRERETYGVSQVTLARFDRLMRRVYENEGLIIYGAGALN